MHTFIIDKLFKELKKKKKYKILLASLTFKENINDFRNSILCSKIIKKRGHKLDVLITMYHQKNLEEYNLNIINTPKKVIMTLY